MFAVYGEAVALLWEVFWDDAGSKSNLQQTGPDTENLVGTYIDVVVLRKKTGFFEQLSGEVHYKSTLDTLRPYMDPTLNP